MRIERIEAIAIEIPLPRRFAGSVYAMTTRCAVITRIATTDGLVSEVVALRDVVADCDCVMEGVVVGDALGDSEPHDEGDVDGDRDEDSVAEALRDVELQPLALRETEDDGVVDAV